MSGPVLFAPPLAGSHALARLLETALPHLIDATLSDCDVERGAAPAAEPSAMSPYARSFDPASPLPAASIRRRPGKDS